MQDSEQHLAGHGSKQFVSQALADVLSVAGILTLVLSALSDDGDDPAILYLGLALTIVGGFLRFRR